MPYRYRNQHGSRLILGELLFWLHLVLIVCLVFSGLVLPLAVVIAVVLAHRIHVHVFGGCVLTEFKKHMGVMPRDLTFLQHASSRFFGQTISRRQSALMDYGFGLSALIVAITRFALTK